MKIAIGNDHAAVEMKQEIRTYLEEKGYEVINFGTDTHESCNYPEYGEAVGRAVAEGKADCGVLICGTGGGISFTRAVTKGRTHSFAAKLPQGSCFSTALREWSFCLF